jgi:aspartate racemase
VLVDAARALQAGGADFIVLCTNTMHKVADALVDAVDVPLLHIGDTTAAAVLATGVRRVWLLGTGFTMLQPYHADRLAAHGLDVLVPSEQDQATVHRIIYDELCVGIVREDSRHAYRQVIGRLVGAGVEGVIYGCTEIELLVGAQDSPVPVFPTTRLHVEAAVDRALSANPAIE